MSLPTRQQLIQRAVAIMGSQKALAERLERSPERISRAVRGARLNIPACLRLADLLHERPTAILRTHGYADEANALERAYEAGGHVSAEERELLDDLAALTSEDREHFSGLIRSLAQSRKGRRPK